jgi:hypothetical protein
MSKKLNERVAALRKRRAEIDARLSQLEAREKAKERKRDTRRKVIAGAYALEHCEFDPDFKATLEGLLNSYLEKPGDRELFDLAPLSAEELPKVQERNRERRERAATAKPAVKAKATKANPPDAKGGK